MSGGRSAGQSDIREMFVKSFSEGADELEIGREIAKALGLSIPQELFA